MCINPFFLRVLYYSKIFINVLRFIIPFGLIFKTILDIYKQILNPKDDDGMKKIKNRVIAAVIVFLVPSIVNLLINFISKVSDTDVNHGLYQCLEFADLEHIKDIETEAYKNVMDEWNAERTQGLSEYERIVEAVRESVNRSQ